MLLLNFKEFICPSINADPIIETNKRKGLKSFNDWLMEMANPSCPKCGATMILRTNKANGNQFYGCSTYPNCKGTMGYSAQGQSPSTTKRASNPEWLRTLKSPPGQVSHPPVSEDWFYAKVIKDGDHRFKINQELAVKKSPNNSWQYIVLTNKNMGVLDNSELQATIQSYRDNTNKPLKSTHPTLQDLHQKLGITPESKPEVFTPTEEQAQIEARFAEMIKDPSQSHMMINALAGTGKTTTLKNLAKKFGKPGEKWLYLVFNTKNKVEATEKFPKFVQVRTTNGFLGEVIGHVKNFSNIPQTERIAALSKFGKEDDSAKLEKARMLVDGRDFSHFMEKNGITQNQASEGEYGSLAKTLNSLLKSIKYEFKEQVLTLTGLSKSFALDPRKDVNDGIKKILDSYDFDTDLSEVKERIAKYKGSFKNHVISALQDILGYDFMKKDFKDAIIEGAKWLLHTSLPNNTSQSHQQGNVHHSLGEFRDFSDDLWYAATHADELHWPHYDIVMADEVQDFNEAQKIMLKKLHDAGAKIVAVGDPNQSIYRFRGADSKAFDNIGNMLTGLSSNKDVVKTLSKNFRSRSAIIDFANSETHVKNLVGGKKFDDGHSGTVTKNEMPYDDTFNQLKQEQQSGSLKETAFIARTNEPLVHTALQLLTNNVPFVIVGKDIAKDLKKHIKKITNKFSLNQQADVSDLYDKLQEFKEDEQETHHGTSIKKAYLQGLKEVTDALLATINQFPGGSIDQYNKWIGQKFGGFDVEENERDLKAFKEKMEKEHPVVLTTAHKSKGLEFDRVFILRYDQFPHKKAKRPEDIAQEDNARYVAITRAKDELHIVKLQGQPGYNKE